MGSTTYNQGDQLMLQCTSEGGPQLEYSWIFSNDMISNNSTLTVDDVMTDDGGDYTCRVNNSAGSSETIVTVYSE